MIQAIDYQIAPEIVLQHLSKAAQLLPAYDAEGLLFFRDTNILAFCGVPLGPSDRLICALMNADAEIAFIVPEFEAEMAAALPDASRILTWKEHQDPYALVADAAQQLGISKSLILLDPHTWIEAQHRLSATMSQATLILDPGLIESVRKIKTPEEVEAIRAACADTGRIYGLVSKRLRPGITEMDLSLEVLDLLKKGGVTPFGELIQGGESASIPHQPTGQRRFRSGDAVIVDMVCKREGYLGDMTRTLGIGPVADEIREAYGVVREAHRAAIQVARPGVTCESVDKAARDVIEAAGLGDYFVHRLGHGIGLDVHEPPFFVRGNTEKLQPGMCITVEPGVYVSGRFGIRIEDVIAITTSGCDVLSDQTPTDIGDAFIS